MRVDSYYPKTLVRHFRAPSVGGCRWCGWRREHHPVWLRHRGCHDWEAPTDAQVQARVQGAMKRIQRIKVQAPGEDAPMKVDSSYPRDAHPCACSQRRDHDGERITTHCAGHCPRVQSGQWSGCRGC